MCNNIISTRVPPHPTNVFGIWIGTLASPPFDPFICKKCVSLNYGGAIGQNRLYELGVFNGFQRLHIFSDGAGKHFKNSKTLRVVRDLSRRLGVPIMYHFSASYHGKGRCDSHFAVGKSLHVRSVLAGDPLICAVDFVELHNKRVTNTFAEEVKLLETVSSYHPCQLRGLIKKFHKIEFLPQGDHFKFWESSSSTSFTLQELRDSPVAAPPIPDGEDELYDPSLEYEVAQASALESMQHHYSSLPTHFAPPSLASTPDILCALCGAMVPCEQYIGHTVCAHSDYILATQESQNTAILV